MATFTDKNVQTLKAVGRYTDPTTPGLNLQVKSSGKQYWTFRFVQDGKRQDIGLGPYPAITLKEARQRAVSIRNDLNYGRKPETPWKLRTKQHEAIGDSSSVIEKTTFADFSKKCITNKQAEWRNTKHAAQWFSSIERYANPVIGQKRLDQIDTDDVLKILNPIWHQKTVSASRLRGRLEWILASATTLKLREGLNPATWRGHLETLLPRPNKIKNEQHHKALPYDQIPAFMTKLRNMDCMSALALEFVILNANRSGEVLGGLRSELVNNQLWIIPASRMKAYREHRVPLGKRSIDILKIATSLDPTSEYLFSKNGKPLSNMALPMMLRRMKLECTVHGFRSSFRDWVAEETMHSPEVAEKALAHAVANKVEAAYRRGDLLEHRKRMMADWESFCMTGRFGTVVALAQQRFG
jgi:integrase